MKKGLKIILIVLVFLIVIIAIDTIQAKVFNNSPILSVKEKFNDYYINKGLFVNHYHCSDDEQKTTWKNTKYSCPVKSNEDVVVKSNEDVVVTTDITLSIKENTLTNSKATLVLKNNSNKTCYYGNPFWIEKKQNGKWYKLELIEDIYFTLPLYNLNSNEFKEWDLNWEDMYGKLESGTYRIVKSISYEYEKDKYKTFNIGAEFNIDSD